MTHLQRLIESWKHRSGVLAEEGEVGKAAVYYLCAAELFDALLMYGDPEVPPPVGILNATSREKP